MPRHVGMYRRSELIRQAGAPSDRLLGTAAARTATANCAAGRHRQETDETTGNEVCRDCAAIVDDYADVAEQLGVPLEAENRG